LVEDCRILSALLTNNSRNKQIQHPLDVEFATHKAPFFSRGAAVFFGRNPKKMGAHTPRQTAAISEPRRGSTPLRRDMAHYPVPTGD